MARRTLRDHRGHTGGPLVWLLLFVLAFAQSLPGGDAGGAHAPGGISQICSINSGAPAGAPSDGAGHECCWWMCSQAAAALLPAGVVGGQPPAPAGHLRPLRFRSATVTPRHRAHRPRAPPAPSSRTARDV